MTLSQEITCFAHQSRNPYYEDKPLAYSFMCLDKYSSPATLDCINYVGSTHQSVMPMALCQPCHFFWLPCTMGGPNSTFHSHQITIHLSGIGIKLPSAWKASKCHYHDFWMLVEGSYVTRSLRNCRQLTHLGSICTGLFTDNIFPLTWKVLQSYILAWGNNMQQYACITIPQKGSMASTPVAFDKLQCIWNCLNWFRTKENTAKIGPVPNFSSNWFCFSTILLKAKMGVVFTLQICPCSWQGHHHAYYGWKDGLWCLRTRWTHQVTRHIR